MNASHTSHSSSRSTKSKPKARKPKASSNPSSPVRSVSSPKKTKKVGGQTTPTSITRGKKKMVKKKRDEKENKTVSSSFDADASTIHSVDVSTEHHSNPSSPTHPLHYTVSHSASQFSPSTSLSSSITINTSVQNLQQKLIQLSLEIEDQEKTVMILTDEMKRLTEVGEVKQKEIARKYREDFKNQAAEYKDELSKRLENCDRLTAKKQELASDLKRLQGKIKMAEDRAKAAVEKVRKDGEREINEAAASWGEGEIIRREKWIERKTTEIREITIKGLEPEVQRIIDKHKKDCQDLEDELEMKKRDFLVDFHKDLDAKKLETQEKAMKNHDQLLSTVRVAGNDRLSEVHEEHAKNLAKLRKRLSEETDSQRVWQGEELKRLAETHADEMQSFRSTESKRLHEMRRRWIEEKDAAERQLNSALGSMESDASIAKEQWENKVRHKLEKESLDKIAKERAKIKKERDREIEREIRRIQGATAKLDLECKEKVEAEKKKLKQAADKKIKGIVDKKSRWGDRLGENLDVVRELQERKRSCESTLKALSDYMQKMDSDIEKVIRDRENEFANLVEEEERYKMESTTSISSLHTMRASLKSQISSRRQEIEQLQARHKAKVKLLEQEHDKDLLAVERRVKIDVGLKEARIAELRSHVHSLESRCSQLQNMIASYKNRQREKATGTTEKGKVKEGSPKKNHSKRQFV
ncbi:hypothetical protein TrVE_jg11821 [Triparma verrucosa]|uniref:Uncharacterized protein n=1 Tax=Triparma verrucosa TaxID=1606542 RepID=A0A9W7B697_9STRA|nr:hypothetical protein TrVE_jg11821 [Triparma verrucosa]